MKFTISSSALLSVLAATGKVVSNKNTLPILDFFLFDLKDGKLKVTASDLETTLVSTIAVDNVEREGIIAAPVKLMLDSLKEFSEQPLTIEADENTWEITVSWKSGSIKIPGSSGLGYPALPELVEEKTQLDMDVDMMICGINKTIFATADDDLRPVMNGVYINLQPEALTFVGTDAHKLVKYESEYQGETAVENAEHSAVYGYQRYHQYLERDDHGCNHQREDRGAHLAQLRVVFTDTGGKGDGVHSVQSGHIGADGLGHAIAEGLHCIGSVLVAHLAGLDQVAEVAGHAGHTLNTGLLI